MKRAQTQEEWQAQMAEYKARRDKAMAEAGVKAGDVVEWHNVGAFNSVVIKRGTLYIAKNEQPCVKVDGDRKKYGWHKGWMKVEGNFLCCQ